MNWLKMMAKFALFCTFSLLTFVQALLSTPKTPTVLTLKRTSSTLLAEKPVYPPMCNRTRSLPAGNRSRSLPAFCCGNTDSKIALVESKVRLLEAKVLRLEDMLASILQVLETCDDTALLEKNTCAAVIYNEELTKTRPLRLLRSELKIIHDKFMK
jgi:hypothetical protein